MQLWERKRNKCSPSTLERFRWLFTFKISKYHILRPCWILGKINYMTKWRQRIRKVADTKSSPSTLIQISIVFKLFPSGERFQKVPFSWIFLCVLVWTEAVFVTIKLRFQIYPAYTCGRGPSLPYIYKLEVGRINWCLLWLIDCLSTNVIYVQSAEPKMYHIKICWSAPYLAHSQTQKKRPVFFKSNLPVLVFILYLLRLPHENWYQLYKCVQFPDFPTFCINDSSISKL